MEHVVLEESGEGTGPSAAAVPTIVVVQTVAEDRGFPAHVRGDDAPLPPAGVPVMPIARLVALPYCELLLWPMAILRWLLGAPHDSAG
jgi:hypothetical protein